jgi:hypothetical protein
LQVKFLHFTRYIKFNCGVLQIWSQNYWCCMYILVCDSICATRGNFSRLVSKCAGFHIIAISIKQTDCAPITKITLENLFTLVSSPHACASINWDVKLSVIFRSNHKVSHKKKEADLFCYSFLALTCTPNILLPLIPVAHIWFQECLVDTVALG